MLRVIDPNRESRADASRQELKAFQTEGLKAAPEKRPSPFGAPGKPLSNIGRIGVRQSRARLLRRRKTANLAAGQKRRLPNCGGNDPNIA
jgi:hypothetical protein